MIEAIGAFFNEYGLTILIGVISCICVGCLVEIFKQSVFSKLEEKYKDDPDKLTKIKTIKAGCAFALAAILTGFFLLCIWKSGLPRIGGIYAMPIWFTAMYLLQMLVDIKGIKGIIKRILDNVIKSTTEKPEEKKKKLKKVVNWVEVEE